MKKVLFFAAFALIGRISFGQGSAPAPSADIAVVTWDSQSFDFGKIKQGVPITHEFKFTNTGKVPFIIANVSASCGCTTPDWTREPVPPGQTGFVKATYNAGAKGVFDKTVTVTGNIDPGFVQLKIKGEVADSVIQ